MIKNQSPWVEDIAEYGEINFDKLLHLLTGFRSIDPALWDQFDELEGVINRLGQGNLTTLMQKVISKTSNLNDIIIQSIICKTILIALGPNPIGLFTVVVSVSKLSL